MHVLKRLGNARVKACLQLLGSSKLLFSSKGHKRSWELDTVLTKCLLHFLRALYFPSIVGGGGG